MTRVSGKSRPKEPKIPSSKFGKNIKLDNITFEGNSGDINWEDLIKTSNTGGEDEGSQQ